MEGAPDFFPLGWNHPVLFLFMKAVLQLLEAELLKPSDPRELNRNLESFKSF